MGFRLEKVGFSYKGHQAISELSLVLDSGRFHAVLGPNGCGKTTLLDLLSGHLRPETGKIFHEGQDLKSFRRRELAQKIALVPQEYHVNFPYTVREVVAMGRYPHQPRFGALTAHDAAFVDSVMKTCHAEKLSERFVTELSGGEKQRVIFARALAQQTPVLLLDEPCASLDIKHALGILHVAANRVRNHEVTVVAVMHDINLAARYADHLVFMKQGRLVASGPTKDALAPQTLETVFEVDSRVVFEKNIDAPQVVFL